MKNFAETDINRFIEAQEVPYFCGYKQALEEIKNGRKTNHWIWYIFPQLRCLGRSSRRITMELPTERRHNAIWNTLYLVQESERLPKLCLSIRIKQHCQSLEI